MMPFASEEKYKEYHREYSRNWYYKNKKVDPNPPPVGMKKCRMGHIHDKRSCPECRRIWDEKNKENIKVRANEWRKANPEKVRKIENKYRANAGKEQILKKQSAWRKNNPEKVRLIRQRQSRKVVETLSDSYVARTLGLKVSDVPADLMQAKRSALQVKHLIKELKK